VSGDKFVECNECTLKMFGVTREQIVGQPPYRFSPLTQPDGRDSRESAIEKINAAIAGVPQFFEWTHSRFDDTTFDAEVSLNRFELEGRVFVQAIVRDVSERVAMARELKLFNERLEVEVEKKTAALMKAREKNIRSEKLAGLGKLAGMVSHELRNPLGVMRNSVAFLKMKLGKGESEEKILRHLEILDEEVTISDKIIGNTLAFGKALAPVLVDIDVNGVLAKLVADLFAPENIAVDLKLEKNLPLIKADMIQTNQLFTNVILNALDAMPSGGSLVITTSSAKNSVKVEIEDTGCGILKENLKKIFDPLFTTKSHGTGLGLAICNDIVERLNGKLKIKSEVGKGTMVTVKIPVA